MFKRVVIFSAASPLQSSKIMFMPFVFRTVTIYSANNPHTAEQSEEICNDSHLTVQSLTRRRWKTQSSQFEAHSHGRPASLTALFEHFRDNGSPRCNTIRPLSFRLLLTVHLDRSKGAVILDSVPWAMRITPYRLMHTSPHKALWYTWMRVPRTM